MSGTCPTSSKTMAFMEDGSGCDMADGGRQVRRPLLGFVSNNSPPHSFNTSSGRARRTESKPTTELEQVYLKRSRAGVAGKAGNYALN